MYSYKNRKAHRTVDKDSACLCCGTILVGIRCTYNLKTCEGVLEKLEKLLECRINIDQIRVICASPVFAESTLTKRYSVFEADLKDLRTKYSTFNLRTPEDSLKLKCTSPNARSNVQVTEVIKRCAKSSPHCPRKKARGPLFGSLTQHYSNLDFTPLHMFINIDMLFLSQNIECGKIYLKQIETIKFDLHKECKLIDNYLCAEICRKIYLYDIIS